MGFLDIPSPIPTETKIQPPVSKFQQFLQNYLEQEEKSSTFVAGQTAGIALDKGIDDSPILPEDNRINLNKQVPGLKIPQGTRQDTANALLQNQMKENLRSFVVNEPQNDGVLAWSGDILGRVTRTFDPIVIGEVALATETKIAEGAALVGSKFLPEASETAKFLGRAAVSGVQGGMFGLIDGLTSGEIESKRRQLETGEEPTTRQVVRSAINESAQMAAGGIALHVAGPAIAKGFRLLKGEFKKTPVLDEELTRREEEDNKQQFQDRVTSIQNNHKIAALENNKQAQSAVNDTADSIESSIKKFQETKPEHQGAQELSESLKTIKESDTPLNEKVQALGLVKNNLDEFSRNNNDILESEIPVINANIDKYVKTLSKTNTDTDVGSLSRILSNFRMITPSDYTAMKKIGISQMESGRAVDVEPYVNEAVLQNAQILNDQLDEAGLNRGRVMQATLDSLDVVKQREAKIDENLKNAQDLLKQTKEKTERTRLKGQINGILGLKTVVLHQRAVHEILATALDNGFKKNTGADITGFLQNQLSRDSEVLGGYDNLVRDLGGEPIDEILARSEEKPEAFTPESKVELEKIKTKKELASALVEDAFKCLTGT